MSLEEFFFAEKQKVKLTMKKGQILIRKHNLWHRGTTNHSDKPRLLLSFINYYYLQYYQRIIVSIVMPLAI